MGRVMAVPTPSGASGRARRLEKINAKAPRFGRVSHLETIPFGRALTVERFRLDNGLGVLLLQTRARPSSPITPGSASARAMKSPARRGWPTCSST